MEVFNIHKDQLIAAIQSKIDKIDTKCSSLKHQIYLYSEQRLQDLLRKKQEKSQELQKLRVIKKNNKTKKQELVSTLELLKKQNTKIEAELAEKQKLHEAIERHVIFIDEKNKEERPHLDTYLKELQKHKQGAQNIQYAKSKLKQLQSNYQKQCQEVQYKYRMITLMKDQLKVIRCHNNIQQKHNKQSKTTVQSIEGPREKQQSSWIGVPKTTEDSLHEQSQGSTFRQCI